MSVVGAVAAEVEDAVGLGEGNDRVLFVDGAVEFGVGWD